jgi:hypothetical protein
MTWWQAGNHNQWQETFEDEAECATSPDVQELRELEFI